MGIILGYTFGTLKILIFSTLLMIGIFSKGGTLGWSDGGYLPDIVHRGSTAIMRFKTSGTLGDGRQTSPNLANFNEFLVDFWRFWAKFTQFSAGLRPAEGLKNKSPPPILIPPPQK